ncbi:putative nucleotidyltransferase [Halanaerobium saccharolyticum]|uniref:Putative nucleotidyltransferase n=1 Tax=Halanaerobium saccharolyticum TaxID=43595 RepID=A0A4R7Z874_9FIRM|nr:nucleotidyltransferase domain-containing protein [Halanaerobium saccharolyticum]RAK08172.1 putative nucleotidyltransferase [Halanaerobium saccharolyticum]TDW04379.1 putative nucleotidyltransferase [Halanaerobium saccharolyticum]TDX59670.1 putative nucleotidyltransferase [Halanaerobium saccharolyticum]
MDLDFDYIKSFLIEELKAELIYLFGSYASGKARDDSDLDLAFLTPEKIDDYQRFLTAQKLASELNIEVDLIDLSMASTVFKVQIIQGKLLYAKNRQQKQEFELLVLKKYARLNEERKEIIEKIERGAADG